MYRFWRTSHLNSLFSAFSSREILFLVVNVGKVGLKRASQSGCTELAYRVPFREGVYGLYPDWLVCIRSMLLLVMFG